MFIPIENLPNLDDVDPIVKENVEFKAVETVDDLLPEALVSMPCANAEDKAFFDISKSAKSTNTAVSH